MDWKKRSQIRRKEIRGRQVDFKYNKIGKWGREKNEEQMAEEREIGRGQSLGSRFCRMLPSDPLARYVSIGRSKRMESCRWWPMVKMRILLALHPLADCAKVEWPVNNLKLPYSDVLEGLSFEPKALLVLRRYRPSAFSTVGQDNIQVDLARISTLTTNFTSKRYPRS